MRKLLAILFVLVAVAVGIVISSKPADDGGTLAPDEPGTAVEAPEAGAYDPPAPVADREVEAEEPFDPRGLKVGGGAYGLFGTVVDERGEPVPDAWVGAYSMPFPLMDFEVQWEEILDAPLELSLEPVASTRADAEGRFSLEGLYGRTTYLVGRADKRLTRGRQLVQPHELDGEEGMLLHTVAGASLKGTVRDENGAPMANAEVFVLPSPLYMIQAFRERDIYVERVYTDGSGGFFIDAVPAGAQLMALAFDGATHPGIHEFGPLTRGTEATTEVALMETGALGGTIVDDEGEPVAGAKVVAAPLDFRLVLPVVRDMGAWIVESRADGSFRFPRLPKRNYILAAQGRDGRSALYSANVGSMDSRVAEPVVLQTQHRYDARIVDREGRPVAGAKVSLKSIPTKEGQGGMRGQDVMTDPVALFREVVQEVAPVLLPAETFATTGGDGRFTIAAWRGAQVEVTAPGYGKSDFRLPELEEEQSAALILLRTGGIRGKVVDGDGKPVPFFLVNAEMDRTAVQPEAVAMDRGEESWGEYRARRETAEAEARDRMFQDVVREGEVPVLPEMPMLDNLRNMRYQDSGDGSFELQGLLAGQWRLTVRADGYESGRASAIVVEEEKTTEDVEVVLSRGCTVRGTVIAAGTREPIAGALVSSGRNKEAGFMAYMQMAVDGSTLTRSRADGSFELTGVDDNHRWVHVKAEGFSPAALEFEELEAGAVLEEVVVEVSVGGTIEGRVYDRHGKPLPARMVAGFSPGGQDFWQAPTDEEGYYRADHVSPGQYFVVTAALDDDALFTGDFLSVLGGTRLAQAFIKEGQVVTLDIEDLSAGGCRLSGQILSNGKPVANAAMFAAATETSGMFDIRIATARTDANGEFTFKSLAPGEYRLQVQGREWDGAIDFFVDDIPEDYQVLQAPQGAVEGRVLNELTGEPVDGASVLLVRDDQGGGLFSGFMGSDSPTEWSQTDDQGRFEFDGVSPGEYHVEVRMDRWARSDDDSAGPPLGRVETRRFDLGENESRDMGDLLLPVAASILVRVTSADGAYDRGFQVRAVPEDVEADGAETVEGWGWDGSGEVSGVADGTWTVTVEAEGWASEPLRGVRVRAGERTEVDVKLQRAGMLSVRVLDANGQMPPGTEVRVLDASGQRVDRGNRWAALAAFGGQGDGAVPLGSFAPGTYTVEAEWQGRVRERRVSLAAGAQELVEIIF